MCCGLAREKIDSASGDSRLMKRFIVALAIAALLTQASYAQGRAPSDQQKSDSAKKKADEKATDEAYKAMTKRIPDAPKPDPWGNLRAPSTGGNK
jgi:hypothetical protein